MVGVTVRIDWRTAGFTRELREVAGNGLESGLNYLCRQVKKTLNTPAVYQRSSLGRFTSTPVPATPGAPPRRITGNLQRSFKVKMSKAKMVGSIVSNLVYASPLETWMNHPYFAKTIKREQGKMSKAMERGFSKGRSYGNSFGG